jgi:ABC-2 type transport system ATP-binding protein
LKGGVDGYDVMENSIDVRRVIGYLPENNPLYTEMYVKEYLEFVAGIFKISNKSKRVEEMIEMTGLQIERRKKITMLSKGYRQRVGLAQALIHNPDVLILDEPTSGLDPNQIVEIRNLIKTIGYKKTVMLSTHIMQEVEAICDRVIIIDKGKVVADESISKLQQINEGKEMLIVEFGHLIDSQKLKDLPQVVSVEKISDNTWKIESAGKSDIRPAIFKLAVDQNTTVLTLQKQTSSLEQIFRTLTS